MQVSIKIGRCNHRFAWSLLIILQLSAISLIISSVFTPVWATTENNEFGLYKCNTPCSKDNFRDQRSIVCGQADFSTSFTSESITNTLKSGCAMFKGLEYGLYAYVICGGASIIFTSIWMVSIFTFCSQKNTFFAGLYLGLLAFLAQSAGVIFWVLQSKTVFQCKDFPNDGSQPELCINAGLQLAIAAGVLLGILNLLYCVIGKLMKNKILHRGTRTISPIIVPDNSTIPFKKSAWNN